VKVFQYLSSFTKELPQDVINVLKSYTTHAFTENEIVDKTRLNYILAKYGIELSACRVPSSAGMIAVVFKGIEKETGKKVVIKLKKQGISKRIKEGCVEICRLYEIIKWFYSVEPDDDENIFKVLQPFVDNIDNLLEQCCFDREIRILKEAKDKLGIIREFISIPTCYNDTEDSINSTDFILMEFMEGEHEINNLSTQDSREYAKLIALYHTYHTMRPFHYLNMDLHIGNILMTKDSKNRPHLNIIDFGMSEYVNNEESAAFSKLLSITNDHVKNSSKGVDISTKYDLISVIGVLFDDKSALQNLTADLTLEVNKVLANFIVEIMVGSLDGDHRIMYNVLKTVRQMTNKPIKFKRNVYNFCLGMAIGNKTILNKIDCSTKELVEIYKENMEFLLDD
jgi:predicted unusual protein kinase regulating ubiquinone biosynthesis (AarF/ABC1/UbiB family)